ncbi:MAG: hypothetical protein WDA16_15065 [Candidatus Thermoplasmatota archaeon]
MSSILFFAPLFLLVPAAAIVALLNARAGGPDVRERTWAWGLAVPSILLVWAGIVLSFPVLLAGPPRGTAAAALAVLIVTIAAAGALLAARLVRDWRLAVVLASIASVLALLPQTRGAGFALAGVAWPRVALLAPPRLRVGAGVAHGAAAVASSILILLSSGAGSLAHQSWALQISPADGADYTLRLPFLTSDDEGASDMLRRLRESLHVAEGDAALRLLVDGTVLEVQGRGGARIESSVTFVRESGDAESFVHYLVPDAPLVENGTPTMRLSWSVDLSGGGGGACRALDERSFTLQAGTPARFAGSDAPPGPARLRIDC